MDIDLKTPLQTQDLSRFVYLRGIQKAEIAELPEEALAQINDLDKLVVVTNGEGQKLAIIEGHEAALAAAKAYELQPMSLH